MREPMQKVTLMFLVATTILGCASQQQKDKNAAYLKTRDTVLVAQKECRKKFPSQQGNHFKYAQCGIKASEPLLTFYPPLVLAQINSCNADILDLANKADRGMIAESDYGPNAEVLRTKCAAGYQQALSQATYQQAQIDAQNSIAQSQSSQAMSSSMAATATMMNAFKPAPVTVTPVAPRTNVNCTTSAWGGSLHTNCY